MFLNDLEVASVYHVPSYAFPDRPRLINFYDMSVLSRLVCPYYSKHREKLRNR